MKVLFEGLEKDLKEPKELKIEKILKVSGKEVKNLHLKTMFWFLRRMVSILTGWLSLLVKRLVMQLFAIMKRGFVGKYLERLMVVCLGGMTFWLL